MLSSSALVICPSHLPSHRLICPAKGILHAKLLPALSSLCCEQWATPADRAKLACANGYDDNETFADDTEILKPMTDGSEDAYRNALEIWAE